MCVCAPQEWEVAERKWLKLSLSEESDLCVNFCSVVIREGHWKVSKLGVDDLI